LILIQSLVIIKRDYDYQRNLDIACPNGSLKYIFMEGDIKVKPTRNNLKKISLNGLKVIKGDMILASL